MLCNSNRSLSISLLLRVPWYLFAPSDENLTAALVATYGVEAQLILWEELAIRGARCDIFCEPGFHKVTNAPYGIICTINGGRGVFLIGFDHGREHIIDMQSAQSYPNAFLLLGFDFHLPRPMW